MQWLSVGAHWFSGRVQWLQILSVSTEIRYMLVIRCIIITSQQHAENEHWGRLWLRTTLAMAQVQD